MPLSDDDKQLLADWARHPGADIARRWLIEKRRAEETALGKRLLTDPSGFDPVDVAREAGKHSGRMELLNQAFWAAQAIAKESDS